MTDDVLFETIIPDDPLPLPGTEASAAGEEWARYWAGLTHGTEPAQHLAVTGEFFGIGLLFPTFNAGYPRSGAVCPGYAPTRAHASHRWLSFHPVFHTRFAHSLSLSK